MTTARTILLTLAALTSVGIVVQARHHAMKPPPPGLQPYPFQVAVPVDKDRAADAVGLPKRIGDFALVSAQRSGNDARHLVYRANRRALSVFVTGRRYTALQPIRDWEEVSLGPGRAAYVRSRPDQPTAVAWIHQNRRCVAVCRLSSAELLALVREIASTPRTR